MKENNNLVKDVATMVSLTRERDELIERIKQINKRREAIEGRIIDGFTESGCTSMSVDGCTVFSRINRYVSVKPDKRADAVSAAVALGLDAMVTLQPSSFAAWAREHIERVGQLPDSIASMVNVYSDVSVSVRKV